MEDFQNWTNENYLIHLSTNGALYNCSNGRGRAHTKKILDIVVCNHRWLDSRYVSSYMTLTKANSDNYPIM